MRIKVGRLAAVASVVMGVSMLGATVAPGAGADPSPLPSTATATAAAPADSGVGTATGSVAPTVATAGTGLLLSFSATNTSTVTQDMGVVTTQPTSGFVQPAGPGTNCVLVPSEHLFPPFIDCEFPNVPPGATVTGSYPYQALYAGTETLQGGLNGSMAPSFSITITVQPSAPVGGARLAATPDGSGYWVLGPGGAVNPFGTAVSYGSTVGLPLNAPVVAIAATPDGQGYWEAAADGGVFSFGDAVFYGSVGGQHLNQPVVGLTPTPDGMGYWLVASDGGVFTSGDAAFYGSLGGTGQSSPSIGLVSTSLGSSYRVINADGTATGFGGSTGVGLSARPTDA
jgi:hypothetical protein